MTAVAILSATVILAITLVGRAGATAPGDYDVTSAPGDATCTATAPELTCEITGLTEGATYTFSVVATNKNGTSPAASSAATLIPENTDPITPPTTTPPTTTPPTTTPPTTTPRTVDQVVPSFTG